MAQTRATGRRDQRAPPRCGQGATVAQITVVLSVNAAAPENRAAVALQVSAAERVEAVSATVASEALAPPPIAVFPTGQVAVCVLGVVVFDAEVVVTVVRPLTPAGPCGPVAPVAPVAPAGPAGPCGP